MTHTHTYFVLNYSCIYQTVQRSISGMDEDRYKEQSNKWERTIFPTSEGQLHMCKHQYMYTPNFVFIRRQNLILA